MHSEIYVEPPNILGICLFKNPVLLYKHFRLDLVFLLLPVPEKLSYFTPLVIPFGNLEVFEKQKNSPV